MDRFNTWRDEKNNQQVVTDAKSGYEMLVSFDAWKHPSGRVSYQGYVGKSQRQIPITARDYSEYVGHHPGIPVHPALRWIEVGPGAGGFMTHLCAQHDGNPESRPVAIDPADFESLEGLTIFGLAHAGRMGLLESTGARLDELQRRCALMRDETKVRLINTTFLKALDQHPDLRQSADVVVELCAAKLYPEVEVGRDMPMRSRWRKHVRSLYRELLRPGGVLLS